MHSAWLKVKSAAAYADVSERTIRTWLKSGLRHVRPNGGSILIKVAWMDEFLENSEVIINEAEKISRKDIADALDGLPPQKMHCSNLGADALKKAIKNYRDENNIKVKSNSNCDGDCISCREEEK